MTHWVDDPRRSSGAYLDAYPSSRLSDADLIDNRPEQPMDALKTLAAAASHVRNQLPDPRPFNRGSPESRVRLPGINSLLQSMPEAAEPMGYEHRPRLPSLPGFGRPIPGSPSLHHPSSATSESSSFDTRLLGSPGTSPMTYGSPYSGHPMSLPARRPPPIERSRPRRASAASSASANSAADSNGTYPCMVEDCPAQPFPSRYLLESHSKVHSDTRSFFCSDPECSQSRSGAGFKRQNELDRHMKTVHGPSKHVCPYCMVASKNGQGPRERTYPRRDNLQRHIRTCHPEMLNSLQAKDARLKKGPRD